MSKLFSFVANISSCNKQISNLTNKQSCLQYVNLLQMIHQTVTFVVITTLHLEFVSFTAEIYRTDPPVWSQIETTTDWEDQTSGTAYQQMASTIYPVFVNNVANTFNNDSNVSLENLLSTFNITSYVGNCTDLQEQTDADEFYNISDYGEFPDGFVRTTLEMYGEIKTLIKTALWFICTENTTVGYDVITTSQMYVHNYTEFIVRLNGSAATIGEVSVSDTVADVYRTSIQHVECVMELVEHLTEMIAEENKVYALLQNISQKREAINFLNEFSLAITILGEFKEVISLLQNILEKAGNMSEHKDGNPFINVITSSNISRFLDAQYWAKLLEEETENLDYYQTGLRLDEHTKFMRYQVNPVIKAIVLVVGITGNVLLLAIFVRHKETRTVANSMLINLTVVDILSLVVNGLFQHVRVNTSWPFGWLGCKVYIFVAILLIAVSTYSVAIISIQRFVAIKLLPSLAWCHHSQKTKYVLIATVWFIGCIPSLPRGLMAHMKNGKCKSFSFDKSVPVFTAELIMFCGVPLLITAVFSGLTAYRIRRSVGEIPGEETGHEQVQHNRMVSSNVLFALTVIFVVSYTPYFLFNFLIFVMGITVNRWAFLLVNSLLFHLRFANCCLNPIVLFVLSKRYRDYIKRYCSHIKCQPATSSGSSIETSL